MKTFGQYRSILCLLLCFAILLLAISLFWVDSLPSREFRIDQYSLPIVAFWEDNRTLKASPSPPLPVTTADRVNLTNLTLVITACCRNVEKHLSGFRRNVYTIGNLFRNYRLYLFESDSSDDTLNFLKIWAKNDSKHIYVRSGGYQRWRLPFRAQRMAHCRNFLLKQARVDLPSFDFYLVLDVDATSSEVLTRDNFLSNFIYPSTSWAVMTASQINSYYDVWALRTWPTMPYDYMERARQLSSSSTGWWSWKTNYHRSSYWMYRLSGIHTKSIPRNHSLIDVESAFGGAAIYNARYLSTDCVYNGWLEQSWWRLREQCEHVVFNQCIRRNAGRGKFFINPMFQIF